MIDTPNRTFIISPVGQRHEPGDGVGTPPAAAIDALGSGPASAFLDLS
jgi:hypothetical protein